MLNFFFNYYLGEVMLCDLRFCLLIKKKKKKMC
jgi:hypothetical protein